MRRDLSNGKIDELKVVAFYSFRSLDNESISTLLDELTVSAERRNIKGTILVALEGINGTICGRSNDIKILIDRFKDFFPEESLSIKVSWTTRQAFRRFKIRFK